jgi:hypothetical protein
MVFMVSRAWFALSVLWFVAVCGLTHWGDISAESREISLLMAVFPVLLGLFLKVFARYVVTGRFR